MISSFSVTNHSLSLPDTHIFLLLGNQSLSFVTRNTRFPPSRSSFALFCYQTHIFSSFSVIYRSLLLPDTHIFLLLGNQSLSFVTRHTYFPPSRSSFALFCYPTHIFSSFSVTNHSLSLPDTHIFLLLGNQSLSFVTRHTYFPPSRSSIALFCYQTHTFSSFSVIYRSKSSRTFLPLKIHTLSLGTAY